MVANARLGQGAAGLFDGRRQAPRGGVDGFVFIPYEGYPDPAAGSAAQVQAVAREHPSIGPREGGKGRGDFPGDGLLAPGSFLPGHKGGADKHHVRVKAAYHGVEMGHFALLEKR